METKNFTDSSEIRESSDLKSYYEPPIIEIIEVSVEKDFADSSEDFGDGTW
jgi:hypothetical protein